MLSRFIERLPSPGSKEPSRKELEGRSAFAVAGQVHGSVRWVSSPAPNQIDQRLLSDTV
jgi:hypothetical protein